VTIALAARRSGFPFPAAPPLVASTLGALLHVVGSDLARGGVTTVALDADGLPARPPRALPLAFVAGLAAAGGELVVTGGRAADETPVALWIDQGGASRGVAQLPAAGAVTHWYTPAAAGPTAEVVWQTDEGARSTLWTAEIRPTGCGPPRALRLDAPTSAVAAAGAAEGVVVARSGGGVVEVLHLVGGRLVARRQVAEAHAPSVALAATGHRYAIAWTDERVLRLSWLDLALRPADGPVEVAVADGPERLRWLRLFGGDGGRLAIGFQRAVREPGRGVNHVVCIVGARGELAFATLEPAGIALDAGGWLDDALVLVHGRGDPFVSVFRVCSRTRLSTCPILASFRRTRG
jgi:hypothetical protein